MEEYLTHDNGGRPFKVQLNESTEPYECNIYTYSNSETVDTDQVMYTTLIFTCNYVESFIGYSRRNSMTLRSRSYGDEYDGNSILLKINDLEYIHIGASIFRFTSLSPIVKYDSPVGRNDVPYPWARDSRGRYYLMTENIILTVTPQRLQNPYMYYYDNNKFGKRIITTVGNASSWFNLGYNPDPCKHYDWLTKPSVIRENGESLPPGVPNLDTPKMYLVQNLCPDCAHEHDTVYTELSKRDYIDMMKNYAEQNGFLKLKKEMIQERL